jgi:hypothetical protein
MADRNGIIEKINALLAKTAHAASVVFVCSSPSRSMRSQNLEI